MCIRDRHKSAEILSEEGNYNVLIPDLYSGGTSLRNYCVQFFMNSLVRNNEPTGNAPSSVSGGMIVKVAEYSP